MNGATVKMLSNLSPSYSHGRRVVLMMAAMGLVLCPKASSQEIDSRVLEAQNQRMKVIREASRSVVAIFGLTEEGGGSGVLISKDGFALSNYHVTSGAGDFMKCGLNDGSLYDAVIVGIDPTGDVALIKMLGRDDFPVATLADSDNVEVGDWVYAMGNPFLLATDFTPTVTYGIVSGTNRYQYPAGSFLEYTDCIQIDASINPGNSGGPLFNSNGHLIGINGRASFEKRGRINSGAAYAISINQIKHFMDHLRSGRIVDHGSLSMTVAATLDGSVVVDQILEASDAYRRGVREQSEIVSFAGRPIRSVNQFKNILGIYPNGWKLPLTFREGGQLRRVMVRLRPLHSDAEMAQFSKKNSGRPKRLPLGQKPPPEPPKQYRKLLVKSPGFANFHFNKLKQDKLHQMLDEWGQFAANETWILSGATTTGDGFEIVLAAKGLGFSLGESESYYQPADDWQAENEPTDSGGFLTAMSHLRRLLTEREKGFTEHVYFGAEPIDGTGEQVDVLRSVEGSIETRWYFSREEPRLLGFDTRLSEDADECEVRFGEFREFDGRRLPSRIEVRTGDSSYGVFDVDKVAFRSGAGAKK
jgi:S1-C subfamily serine protease